MPLLCPTCGEQNSDTARFCQSCGATMAPPPPTPEERKVVSVLFVDLVEFTSRSDQADPEDVRALLLPYHSRVKAEIESFGGIVEKFIGDAVMAVFGAPVSHGDDAERAVRAGLTVLRAIEDLNREQPGLDLTVRAAVNTGEAVVDARSRPDTSQGLATGDVVNTASRLQTGATPGTLVVGEETYHATRQAIAYQPIEPIQAKGKREPLVAWRAVDTLTAPAERPISAGPMIGRDGELELLGNLWESTITERRPRLVTVVGPPGIGKSRLTREFADAAEAMGARVVRGRSLPYGESSGYRAFAQQVKDVAGIFETDPPAEARAKLDAVVAEVCGSEEAEEIAGHLALLAGLATDGAVADRHSLFFSGRRFVELLAAANPLLLVFEDIHWADPSQLDLLESLASRVRDAPAMFLALTRPDLLDSRPGWGAGLTAHTTMELHPLSPDHARRLASNLLSSQVDLGDAAERVVQTAEGNPLFIEELAASISERVDEAAAALPTNVKTTIAARLDALPAPARSALLDAAVIGRVFWRGALGAIAGERDSAEIEGALDLLEIRDFIRREPTSQLQGDREYTFKHMLIRDVAYGTLPRADRRKRHGAVAAFIEQAAGTRREEAAAVLAHHWGEAGDRERALDYVLMAAEHAGFRWAKDEAESLYAQALELIPEERADLHRKIAVRRAETLVELGDNATAIRDLDRLMPELEGRERLRALMARARAAFWNMDAAGTYRFASEALVQAEEVGDVELLGSLRVILGQAASLSGDMPKAFALGDQTLAEWPSGAPPGDLAALLSHLALMSYWIGSYDQAAEYAERCHDVASGIHNLDALLSGESNHGMILTGLGRHDEALSVLDHVIALGRERELVPRLTARALNMSSGAFRELFDLKEARRRSEEATELASRAGFVAAEVQAGVDQLFADLVEGEVGSAQARWPNLWRRAEDTRGWHQWLMAGRLAEARAEIALAGGDLEEAIRYAGESIEQALAVGRLKYETAGRLVLGSALVGVGEAEGGVAELRTALGAAQRLRHPPTLWRAWWSLGRGLRATGDDQGATDAQVRAAETIRDFAATLAAPRAERVLAADPVKEILATG